MNLTFDHIGFVTADMDRTLSFWCDVIGLEKRSDHERGGEWIAHFTGVAGARLRIVHLFGADLHLEFIQFLTGGERALPPAANAPNTGHICIRMRDPQACFDRLIAAGALPQGVITVITEGAIAGKRGAYVRDPNGLLVEILETSD